MNSEKVKEIKKSLECCANCNGQSSCKDCPIVEKCYEDENLMPRLALTLINELESENERIKDIALNEDITVREWLQENQQLKDRIAELEKENITKTDTITDLLNKQEFYEKEKLKQFAERLKGCAFCDEYGDSCVWVEEIDETLKEFIK